MNNFGEAYDDELQPSVVQHDTENPHEKIPNGISFQDLNNI